MTLALIGVGMWGKNYLRAIHKISGAKIKYVCADILSLQDLSSEYVKVKNYKDLSLKKDIDGVIIAVPSSKHYELAEFFLNENKPILLEKPMVTSLHQAEKLKDIFERKKSRILVGHIFLYNPAFQKFVESVSKIGDISYLELTGCDLGPVRKDVSCLWDWGPHDISMALEILKKTPISASAWAVNLLRPNTNLYDMVYGRLLFENNISAFLKIGWLSPIKKREIVVVGQEEFFLFDDVSDKKITHFDKLRNQINVDYAVGEPLVRELEDFIEMIRNNKSPLSNFNKSFAVIEVIDALEKSIKKNGAAVRIKK